MRAKLLSLAAALFLIAGCAGNETRERTAMETDEASTGTSSSAPVTNEQREVGDDTGSEGPDSARVRPGTGGGAHTGVEDATDSGTSR